jgi:hypothetical protein
MTIAVPARAEAPSARIYSGGGVYAVIGVDGPRIMGYTSDAHGARAPIQCPQGGKIEPFLFTGITSKVKRRLKTAGGEPIEVVDRPDFVGFSGPRPVFTGTIWRCTELEGFLQDCPGEEDVWKAQITEGRLYNINQHKIVIKYENLHYEKNDNGKWNCEPAAKKTKTLTLRETYASEIKTEIEDWTKEAKDEADRMKQKAKDKRDSLGDIEDADDQLLEDIEPLDKFRGKTWIEIITDGITGNANAQ